MKKTTSRPFDPDFKLIIAVASAVSLLSFLYYFQRGEILLYGDAVAHINIARRVFDSQTPGLLQLGTVWLPLPHLLMIPFLVSDWMWRTGLGGSIPSMIAFVLGALGIFRLTRGLLSDAVGTRTLANAGAWLATLIYGANPNLIYLQSTAMTEPLYLALFLWAVTYFAEFWRLSTPGLADEVALRRPLYRCAACLAGAELTRYDGWFLAAVIGAVVLFQLVSRWDEQVFRRVAIIFLVSISLAPLLWLVYNGVVYGNPLEFANGPYSAKAIEQRTAKPGYPAHPGAGNVVTAGTFFLKSAELNMSEGNWGRLWIAIALAGAWVGMRVRSQRAVLLLWVPVAFYALSIAYSGVPLFLPAWWPFTWYNLRYGLQLLPLFAVLTALALSAVVAIVAPEGDLKVRPGLLLKGWSDTKILRRGFIAGTFAIVALSYGFIWKAQPLCFTEAWVNSRTRLALDSSVAKSLADFPKDSRFLMYVGEHVGALQQAGIPLRQVVNEGNHRPWRKPVDSQGLWEQALADPTQHVDFVITYEGDAVDQAVDKRGLVLLTEVHTEGQARARIYSARPTLNQSR